MCCIFSCCVWTLDIIQRVLTFLLACVLAGMVVLILAVAIVVGVAYGYNYSMAEFISLSKSDVTIFMRRGLFSDDEDRDSDRPPVMAESRRFDRVSPYGSAVDINNLTPDAAGKARLLADSWEQAKEAWKYDDILSKFTPNRDTRRKERKEMRSSSISDLHKKARGQDNFRKESTKSEAVIIKATKNTPLTEGSIMARFKPVYIEEYNQEQYNPLKENSKTTSKWLSTERRAMSNFKTTNFKNINQKHYNKITQPRVMTFITTKKVNEPDIKIRVGSIKFNTPEEEKHEILEQSSDETERTERIDYSESEEEDRIVKAIQEEAQRLHAEKTLLTSDGRLPGVKIRVGKLNYHTTSNEIKTSVRTRLNSLSTEQFKTSTPDIKIRVESKDYYKPDKNNQQIVVGPLETENYEEQIYRKSLDKKTKTVDKPKPQDATVRSQSKEYYESDKNDLQTDVELLGKEDYEEQIYKKTMNERLNTSRTPDIKFQLQSKDDNESNKINKENIVEYDTEDYGEHNYRKTLNERFKTVDKSKTTIIGKLQNKNESDENNNKTVVGPVEEENYDEQFDRKSSNWRFRTLDRIKFDDGATRHPYELEQPPHPYREEDDDVMYKPV